MKKILTTVGVLIAIVFLGNFVYGLQSVQKIDDNIKLGIENGKIPVNMTYSKIKVNPLFSEFTFYDLDVKSKDNKHLFSTQKLTVNMKYKEALELSQNGHLEKLTFCKLKFNEVDFYFGEENSLFEAEKLGFAFNGSLDQFSIEQLKSQLPTEKQEFDFNISNGKVNQTLMGNSSFNVYSLYANNKISSGQFHITFNPEDHHITFSNVAMSTDEYAMNGNCDLEYSGLNMDDFKPHILSFESNSHSKGKIVKENPKMKGFVYSIESFDNEMSGEFAFGENHLIAEESDPEFALHFKMKGLSFEIPDEQKEMVNTQLSMVGLDADDLKVDEFLVNSELKDGKLVVNDTKLILPILKANLLADLNMNYLSIQGSEINNFNLVVTDIKPELRNSLKGIEQMVGIQFPMEGDDIVFEVKGSLANPQVKGIHY